MRDVPSFGLVALFFIIGLGGLMYYNGNIILGQEEVPATVKADLPVKKFYQSQYLNTRGGQFLKISRLDGAQIVTPEERTLMVGYWAFTVPGFQLHNCVFYDNATYCICQVLKLSNDEKRVW